MTLLFISEVIKIIVYVIYLFKSAIFAAAFVGLPGNFQIIYLPGALILINLFAGKLLAVELCLLRSKNSCNISKMLKVR